jgi:hypothetical protein
MPVRLSAVRVGQRLRVVRDEERWPPKGTWAKYRGRVGTVVSIDRVGKEIGLAWNPRTDLGKAQAQAWLRPFEVEPV